MWRHPVKRKIESYRVWSFNEILKLTIKTFSNLSNINKHCYLKWRILILHRQFFKRESLKPDYGKTFCNDRNNPFDFACRKFVLLNIS